MAVWVLCGIAAFGGSFLTFALGPSTFWFTLAPLGVMASIVYAWRSGSSAARCAAVGLVAIAATLLLSVCATIAWATATAVFG